MNEARTLAVRLMAGAILFIGGMGVAVVSAGEGDGVERPVAAGPEPGARLDRYATARAEALEGVSGTRQAVVSFRGYLPDDAVGEVVPSDPELVLVAVPGGEPEPVDDLDEWREERLEERRAEAAEFERLLPTVRDPEFRAQYERDLEAARAAVRLLRRGSPVVFAVVVRAEAAVLRSLAEDPRVRLVDLVPEGDVVAYRGVRPEERSVAGQPPSRP